MVGIMPKTIINQEIYERAKSLLSKFRTNSTTTNKLKAVMSSYKNGLKKVSEVFDVHVTSIHRWARQIRDNEIESLVNKSKHQDGILIKNHHKEEIAKWLTQNPNLSIKEVTGVISLNPRIFRN